MFATSLFGMGMIAAQSIVFEFGLNITADPAKGGYLKQSS